VGGEIWEEKLPVAAGATVEQALHGGEDYELLFTAAGMVPDEIAGVSVTRVGTVIEGTAVCVDGVELKRGGWEHLR
jgi:thiamine-monophosphate kinase